MSSENIIDELKQNRPNISPTSIKTYYSILKNLYKNTSNGEELFNGKYFIKHQNKILEHLKNLPPSARKTKLAPLVVICGSNNACAKYRELMMSDLDAVKQENHLNSKNEKQKQNWISQEEVLDLFSKYEKSVLPLFSKAKNSSLTKSEFMRLNEFITLALYVLNPPRRILDYTEMKIKNINSKEDNYIKGKKFVFNRYKTQKAYGTQDVEISPKLLKYLKLWMKINPTDYLLTDTRNNKLSQPQLTLRLNNIFGRNVSVNMLRHIFITDKYGDQLEEMNEDAKDMGHSLDQQKEYIKK